MAQSERFYFWRGYWDAMRKLKTNEQRGKLITAMCLWAFESDEPDFSDDPVLDFAWEIISDQIAESVAIGKDMASRGRRGGKASGKARSSASSSASSEGKGTDRKGSDYASTSVEAGASAPAADAAARAPIVSGGVVLDVPPKPEGA